MYKQAIFLVVVVLKYKIEIDCLLSLFIIIKAAL